MSSAEGVAYPAPCPLCPADTEVEAGLVWTGGRLEWGYAYRCPGCGAEAAACGRGVPPADLRDRLLAEHGPSRLDFPGGGVAVMQVLRAVLGISLGEARRVVREGYEATGPEVARVAEAVRAGAGRIAV